MARSVRRRDGCSINRFYLQGQRSRGTWAAAVLLSCLALHAPPDARAQSNDVEGQTRSFYMSLLGRDGKTVPDVRADEVNVVLAGESCTVVVLEPGPPKMTVALMVDSNGGVASYLNPLRTGLGNFLDTLPPEHDVGLYTVSGQTRRRSDFTSDRDELQSLVGGLFPDGDGAPMLLEAFIETWERRFSPEDVWPVFVAVSQDLWASYFDEDEYSELVTALQSRGATAHFVLLSTNSATSPARTVFENLARTTGGTFQVLAAPTALPDILAELATMMGTEYDAVKEWYRALYVCPQDTEGQLQVGIARPDVQLRLFASRGDSR